MQLHLLGGCSLQDDQRVRPLPGAKARALLAYLSCTGEPVSRQQLANLLWGSRFEAQARQSLRQTLSKLRRVVGHDVLVTEGDSVFLSNDAVTSDAAAFESKVADGALEEAVSLYRGELAAGLAIKEPEFSDWLEAERRRYRTLAAKCLHGLANAALTSNPQRAEHFARAAVALDDMDEEAHRLLLKALVASGQRGAAIRHFDRLQQYFREDVRANLDPRTLELGDTIRTGISIAGSAMSAATVAAQADGIQRETLSSAELQPRPPCLHLSGDGTADLALPDQPSIAVLPFLNMSGDPEQQYFSDGISEDIITDLSKISGLFVIARNSSFVYRDPAQNLEQVTRALGVRYVLEGSVRRAANRVRITAQLIDGMTGGQVWAERYDRELEDIFTVQAEVTGEIVDSLRVTLTCGEQRRISVYDAGNLKAYDCYLRAREQVWRLTREATERAQAMIDEAIALNPDFAAAHTMRSLIHTLEYINGWSDDPARSLELGRLFGKQALSMDESDATAHIAMSLVHIWQKRLAPAIAEAERAIALDPNNAFAFSVLASALHYAGRSAEALGRIETAMRLDPHYPNLWLHFLGQIHFMCGRYAAAAAALERRLVRFPETDISRVLLAACYGHLGLAEQARARWQEVFLINPSYSLEQRLAILPYADPADIRRMIEGLSKAHLLKVGGAAALRRMEWLDQDIDA